MLNNEQTVQVDADGSLTAASPDYTVQPLHAAPVRAIGLQPYQNRTQPGITQPFSASRSGQGLSASASLGDTVMLLPADGLPLQSSSGSIYAAGDQSVKEHVSMTQNGDGNRFLEAAGSATAAGHTSQNLTDFESPDVPSSAYPTRSGPPAPQSWMSHNTPQLHLGLVQPAFGHQTHSTQPSLEQQQLQQVSMGSLPEAMAPLPSPTCAKSPQSATACKANGMQRGHSLIAAAAAARAEADAAIAGLDPHRAAASPAVHLSGTTFDTPPGSVRAPSSRQTKARALAGTAVRRTAEFEADAGNRKRRRKLHEDTRSQTQHTDLVHRIAGVGADAEQLNNEVQPRILYNMRSLDHPGSDISDS